MFLVKFRVLYRIVYPRVPSLVIVDQLVTAFARGEQDLLGVKVAGIEDLLYILEKISFEQVAVIVLLQPGGERRWWFWAMCSRDAFQPLVVCEKLIIRW